MTATTVALPKLGTTLFSFTLEMRRPGYTLEGMINQVAELGLGPGLELVGFQSLRGYPHVSAEVVSSFRDQCERTGLEPSAMSMNLDLGLHRGRLMDEDEALAYLEPQIALSHQMGFPVCKATVIPTRSFLEGLVRILEKHGGLKFGYEVHSPMAVDSPEILQLRELYDAIDSPLLGWTPDFSASMHSVPPSLIAAHQESGMRRELTDLAIEVWNSDTTMPEKFGRFALTEHPLTFAVIAVREDLVPGYSTSGTPAADPVSSVICVPFADPGHPFHAQALHMDSCPPYFTGGRVPEPNPAGYLTMGWGCRKFPRAEDGLTFSDTETDQWGMPRVSIQYALTDREHAELGQAVAHLATAAKALGRFVPGGEPKIMPAGSSLHYQGTYRIGDDGGAQSVCDSHAQVWGLDNLFLGGNGTIPTATACNPTLTSVAIAARSVRRVLEVLG